jgi:hypothetical protein
MDPETTLSDPGKIATPPPASLKTPRRRRHVRDVTILSWSPWRDGRNFWIWLAKTGLLLIAVVSLLALFGRLEDWRGAVIGGVIAQIILRLLDLRAIGLAKPLDRKAIIGTLERKGFRGDVGASPEIYRPLAQGWTSDQHVFVTLEVKGEDLRVTGPWALLRRL